MISRAPDAEPHRTPLLFVHGTCHAAWCWDEHFLPFFARRGYAAHAVSLRGHGNSAGAGRLWRASVADYVADVARVARALPTSPVVIGHSLGGLVVQRYIESHDAPAAVLLAPVPVGGMLRPGLPLFARDPLPFLRAFLLGDVRALYGTPARARALLFSADASDAVVDRLVSRLGNESVRALVDMMLRPPRPARARAPVLVVGGADDVIVPPRWIARTAHAYRAPHRVIPHLAHDVMLEARWEAVAEYVAGWLADRTL